MTTISYSREKGWGEISLSCLGLITLSVLLILFSAFLITLVWSLIVPTVFPSAVEMGALPSSLTIVQALKLSILFSILGLTSRSSSKTKKEKGTSYDSFWERVMFGLIAFLITLPILAIFVLIAGLLISLVWGWVVPDVFNGAVGLGLLPATLGFWNSVLLSLLFSVLGLTRR